MATPKAAGRQGGVLKRFQRLHLYDYSPAALRMWVVNCVLGALAMAWALGALALDPLQLLLVVPGLVATGLATTCTIRIPRSTLSVNLSDLAVYGLLALFGPAAAVLAAGVDGWVSASRTTSRLSSRLHTPAIATVSMAIAGGAFVLLERLGAGLRLPQEAVALVALCLASLLQYTITTGWFSMFLATKRNQGLSWEWLHSTSWIAVMQMGAALVAGLGVLVGQVYGLVTIAVVVAAAVGLLLLLRAAVQRAEAERMQHEAQIADARREAELNYQRFMASFTHAAVGMAMTRPDGETIRVNQAVCQLLRRPEYELIGQTFEDWFYPEDIAPHREALDEVRSSRIAAVSMEVRCRVQGLETWASVHCSSFDDPVDGGTCLIYQLHDVTARRAAESKLAHIAYHDSLTDVANRAWFDLQLAEAIERCSQADGDTRFAVVMLDLDRFKIVNDSLGHAGGNMLLIEVAKRLGTAVRPNDLVARLGGDEFALLLRGVVSIDEARRIAERVIEVLAQPIRVMSTEITVRASVGVTLSDLGYRTADEMMRDADLAMYEAKGAGRGRVAVYDSSMHQHMADRMRLEADLAQAIHEGGLSLVYQPVFQLEPYRLTGFEALCRWVHPERGPVDPAQFIPLAEESGLIASLTPWVIETAVRQLASWRRIAPHLSGLSININVSGRDLALQNFADKVRASLVGAGVPAPNLTLEITETSLMHRLDTSLEVIRALRDSGVHFAIDDFGTGYSSLAYLSSLPIDAVKIDRSFINGMDKGLHNVEIVRAVNRLGQVLGKKVVAEGIETVEQLLKLRNLDVHSGQGYLLSRPLGPEQIPELLFSTMQSPVAVQA